MTHVSGGAVESGDVGGNTSPSGTVAGVDPPVTPEAFPAYGGLRSVEVDVCGVVEAASLDSPVWCSPGDVDLAGCMACSLECDHMAAGATGLRCLTLKPHRSAGGCNCPVEIDDAPSLSCYVTVGES